MADPVFDDPRLAGIYDQLDDPQRPDLAIYTALVDELGVTSVLDVGCGTGSFACLLAARGVDVVGVDPAKASLDVARSKRYADRVCWLLGDATSLPDLHVDLVTMTANVAQVFLTDEDWIATLQGIHAALKPGGHLVFETRDPASMAWNNWNRELTLRMTDIPGVGRVETWTDVTEVNLPLVSFRQHYVLDGVLLTSDSTLRFRQLEEVEGSLVETGFVVDEVRNAPDGPGLEFVFIASV